MPKPRSCCPPSQPEASAGQPLPTFLRRTPRATTSRAQRTTSRMRRSTGRSCHQEFTRCAPVLSRQQMACLPRTCAGLDYRACASARCLGGCPCSATAGQTTTRRSCASVCMSAPRHAAARQLPALPAKLKGLSTAWKAGLAQGSIGRRCPSLATPCSREGHTTPYQRRLCGTRTARWTRCCKRCSPLSTSGAPAAMARRLGAPAARRSRA
mmetsp:Transcript_29082/g.86110  ORF Transcript_29082/g.86110 Transcript_29082/m.86110 type:complete len:211 (-) Transcript_29082:1072-1704(-)